jgi:hypothetical protein
MNRQHERLEPGTAVYHGGQRWAVTLVGGTARILSVDRLNRDGSWEYTVLGCRDISRQPGPGNPMDQERQWCSSHTRRAWTEADDQFL